MSAVEVRHALLVSSVSTTRRLRRLMPIPLLTPRTVGLCALAAVIAGAGMGLWAGSLALAFGISGRTLGGGLVFLGIVAGAGSGSIWGELRVGLGETRSWSLSATLGAEPRAVIIGRHLVGRLVRGAIVWCALVAALIASTSASADGSATATLWAAVVFALPGTAACGIAYAFLRLVPGIGRRAVAAVTAVIVLTLGSLALWIIAWTLSLGRALAAADPSRADVRAGPVADAVLTVCAITAMLAAGLTVRHARRLRWADVVARAESIRGRACGRLSRVSGGRRIAELALLDVRRASRSFEWRVRPPLFTILAMTLAVVALGALGAWLAPELVAAATSQPVGATVVGGICAGYCFVVFSALAPLVSLDSDRGATTLMRSLPGGIRALAVTRAATGALVTGGSGVVFIGLLWMLAPLGANAVATAAASCATVAVVAPALGCFAALRHPQTAWKEAAEIGQRGWTRVLATYAVGVSIAGSLVIFSGLSWDHAAAAIAVAAAVFVPPVLAGLLAALLPTTIGVSRASRT